MQQQVNLFQPVFRRETKVFSARALAQVLGLAAVLMVASVALLQLQLGRQTATRDLLDGQYRLLDARLQTLERRADPAETAALEARAQELETRLAEGRLELSALETRLREHSLSFAQVLETLARHPHAGVWLTAIRTQEVGLELEGGALDTHRLLDYLADLNADPALQRWPLTAVQIDRVETPDAPARLRFVLRSSADGEDLH